MMCSLKSLHFYLFRHIAELLVWLFFTNFCITKLTPINSSPNLILMCDQYQLETSKLFILFKLKLVLCFVSRLPLCPRYIIVILISAILFIVLLRSFPLSTASLFFYFLFSAGITYGCMVILLILCYYSFLIN